MRTVLTCVLAAAAMLTLAAAMSDAAAKKAPAKAPAGPFPPPVPAQVVPAVPPTAAPRTAAPPSQEEGFFRIFNGTDMANWDGDPEIWTVRDGVLRAEVGAGKAPDYNTYCFWRGGTLRNFILKLRYRIRAGATAVAYRGDHYGSRRIKGYLAELSADPGGSGLLTHEAGRGPLAGLGDFAVVGPDGKPQPAGRAADPEALLRAEYHKPKGDDPDAWNECTVIARGNHLVHIINGYQTVELIDADPSGRALWGTVALQVRAGVALTAEFKDIRAKRIRAEFGDAVLLFAGRDLAGWVPSSDQLKDAFSVKDACLHVAGRPAGYLRTQQDFTNFVLSLQLRHLKGGNGGVLLRMTGPDKVWPRSIECQGQAGALGDIWNIDQFPMKVDPARTTGRHTRKLYPSNEKPLGEWNRYELTLDGGSLELAVNGLVQNTAADCQEVPGKICLQSEGAEMQYRNIVLLPILRSPAAPAPPARGPAAPGQSPAPPAAP